MQALKILKGLTIRTENIYLKIGRPEESVARNDLSWFCLSVREGKYYNFCIRLGDPCGIFIYWCLKSKKGSWALKVLDKKNTG